MTQGLAQRGRGDLTDAVFADPIALVDQRTRLAGRGALDANTWSLLTRLGLITLGPANVVVYTPKPNGACFAEWSSRDDRDGDTSPGFDAVALQALITVP